MDSSLFSSNDISSKLLKSLGVRELNLKDVLEILKTVFSSTDDLQNTKTTAQWLIVLYHCINNYSLQQEEILVKQLKQLEFIPILRHGAKEMVSLEKCSVFFPTSNLIDPTVKKSTNKIFNLIENDLNLLDVESLLCLDQLKNAQIVSLLKNLGVKPIEPKDVLECHIIDAFKEDKCSDETRILYLIYVHECYSSLSQLSLDKLKEHLLIKTNKGFTKVSDTIFLTPTYGNKYDLKLMFSSYKWCLVDSIYYERSFQLKSASSEPHKGGKQKNLGASGEKSQFMLSWRKFLIIIGNFFFNLKVIHLLGELSRAWVS